MIFIKTENFEKEYKESSHKEKIKQLIKSIEMDGLLNGIGKPEFLKYDKAYSRRINSKDRLIYKMRTDMETIDLLSCKGHYDNH